MMSGLNDHCVQTVLIDRCVYPLYFIIFLIEMLTAAQQLSFSRLFLALNTEVIQLYFLFIVCVCLCVCDAVYESDRSFPAVGNPY